MKRHAGIAMLPTKRNRLIQLPVDAVIYALRSMVEHGFTSSRMPGASQPVTTKPLTVTSASPTSSQCAFGHANLSTSPSFFSIELFRADRILGDKK